MTSLAHRVGMTAVVMCANLCRLVCILLALESHMSCRVFANRFRKERHVDPLNKLV